jgi:hypothetical protein
MKAAVDGVYNGKFFGSANTDEGYEKRLRAVIQNTLTEFAEDMRKNGHTRMIIEFPSSGDRREHSKVSRAEYILEVKALMRRSRGCELPGTFSPLVIGELFREQCRPWQDITVALGDRVIRAVHQTTEAILNYVAVEETIDSLTGILNTGIEKLKSDLKNRINELLDPHYQGHPITYNHYLTETVQKIQSERQKARIEEALKHSFELEEISQSIIIRTRKVDFTELVGTLMGDTEADMERHASSVAVDFMQAYYKVIKLHNPARLTSTQQRPLFIFLFFKILFLHMKARLF